MADSVLQDLTSNITATQAAKLDATVSSRLPTTSYTAPDNADIVAIKAKTDNLPASPASSTNLDAAVSTRLATSSYTAPDNTSITAIKAKTDNIPATPASQADAQAGATVPTADSTANTGARDAVGNKTDAAVTTVGTTKSIVAYVKGILSWITVPSADNTANASVADLLGNKTDAAVTSVGNNKTLMAYVKGLINTNTTPIPAHTTPATLQVDTTSSTDGNFSAWVQVIASTGSDIHSINLCGSFNPTASVNQAFVEIGVGGSGSEVLALGCRFRDDAGLLNGSTAVMSSGVDLYVPSGSRISIRTKTNGAGSVNSNWYLNLARV